MPVCRFYAFLAASLTLFSLSVLSDNLDNNAESVSNIKSNVFNIKHASLLTDSEFDSLNSDQNNCSCGNNTKTCELKDGLKYCTCNEGFVSGINGVCTEMCNDSRPCENGGTCNEGLCVCPPRTKGIFCEKISLTCWRDDIFESYAQVRGLRCCCSRNKTVRAQCIYDIKNHNPYCKCQKEYEVYDDNSETCKECNCGEPSTWTKCDYYNSVKTCFCVKNYEYNPNTSKCEPCNCGDNSEKCEFTRNGVMKCKCRHGFTVYNNACKKCDCGPKGYCTFRGDKPFCQCDKGFQSLDGSCIECKCGEFGACVTDESRNKTICECETGYSESSIGKCEYCYCGDNGVCSFDSNDRKNCSCPYGYTNINGFCRDIDECEGDNPCPAKEKCINLPGSYICGCADGYLHTGEGCSDINECVDVDICGDNDCVNTPGSYECRCKEGYLSRGGPKNSLVCQSDSSTSIGYGILSSLFAIIVIGLLVVLFRTYRK